MKHSYYFAAIALGAQLSTPALANPANPEISFVLDGYYKSEDTALQEKEKGFGLGHTELSLQSSVDDLFFGRLTAVLESHEDETEIELEEAFINTTSLPMGLDVRAGRFLSQVGYLNSRHTHTDQFAERPAVYRAILGTHYFDDGVGISALLPTPFYWRVGAEAFKGDKLAGGEEDESIGVYTIHSKWGGDINESNSWQLGTSFIRNRLTASTDEDEEEGHSHDAAYSGKNTYIADAVWKWAPNGNSKNQQLTVAGEYFYVDELNQHAASDDAHEGWYASAAYRFLPQWTVGIRHSEADLKEAHDDHFHNQELHETDLAISWSRSHFSTIRLQFTHQEASGLENEDNAITLQYVMTFGAHGAHEF